MEDRFAGLRRPYSEVAIEEAIESALFGAQEARRAMGLKTKADAESDRDEKAELLLEAHDTLVIAQSLFARAADMIRRQAAALLPPEPRD